MFVSPFFRACVLLMSCWFVRFIVICFVKPVMFLQFYVLFFHRFLTTAACQTLYGGPICPHGVQLGLDLPLSGGLAGLSEPVCGTVFLSFF